MCREKKRKIRYQTIYTIDIYKKRYRGQIYDNKKIQRETNKQSRKEKKRERREKREKGNFNR